MTKKKHAARLALEAASDRLSDEVKEGRWDHIASLQSHPIGECVEIIAEKDAVQATRVSNIKMPLHEASSHGDESLAVANGGGCNLLMLGPPGQLWADFTHGTGELVIVLACGVHCGLDGSILVTNHPAVHEALFATRPEPPSKYHQASR